jgi:hypothetical protein
MIAPIRLCKHPGCKRPAAPHRCECEACKRRRARERNPWWAAWETKRTDARNRGIRFAVSLQDFRAELEPQGYDPKLRGCWPGAHTVDRMDPRLGYVPGNLRALEFMDNCRKGGGEDRAVLAGQAFVPFDEEDPF